MSNSFQSLWLQHTSLPCPLLSPGVCSNSCLLSRWCHPIISSSVVPFSYSQSFPASGSFPMSWLFKSGDQNIGASASVSVIQIIIQVWIPPLGLMVLSLCHPQDSQKSSPASHFESINSCVPTLISVHDCWKHHSLDYTDIFGKVISLFLNPLSRFIIASLPRNKCFYLHGCSHCLQWFLRPRKENLSLFPLLTLLFVVKCWDRMPWS